MTIQSFLSHWIPTGFLAGFYAATLPHKGLQSLIISNAYSSIEQVLTCSIASFGTKHICTLRPWQKDLTQSFEENNKDPTVADKL